MKSLKDHIQEKKMDPVGKADADIDNDGDVDSSDKYLHNRRKAIKKAMKKEEAQVDEGAYKGKDAFGRGVTAALRGGKAGAYMSKKAKERSDMNKKNDPGSAKKGYALSVTDKAKAMKKARKKGLNPKHPTTNYKRKLPEEAQKKDHQTISYVTHGGQKGKVQVHKNNAFKALNHYRKNNKSAQFESKIDQHPEVKETQVDEVMSSPARAAHRGMFKAALGKAQDQNAQKDRLARLKKKGWVKNDRGGMSKVSEDMLDEDVTTALKKKSAKSGISVSTLRKVYNRGVAAWRTGHRPGTTPSQWGMARVNSYITKGKGTYHGADKDLREDVERHADVKMVKTKTPDGRPIWKKQRKETEVSKHNEGVDYHHIDDIEIAIGEFVGIEKLQEALNRLQQMKFAKAAKELKAYAKKRGGIDKKDFMMAAQLMDDGEAMELAKFVKKMDTDPRDYVYTVMAKHGLMKKR